MKREIKFKAKRIECGRWIEGSYSHHTDAKGNERHRIIYKNGNPNDIDEETLCQYTGLKDKNGDDIFEGDILKGAWRTIIEVYYDEYCAQFRAKVKNSTITREIDYYGECEIIGNIHDNPELLNQ